MPVWKRKMRSQKFSSVPMPWLPMKYELLCLLMSYFENFIITFSPKLYNLMFYELGYYYLILRMKLRKLAPSNKPPSNTPHTHIHTHFFSSNS